MSKPIGCYLRVSSDDQVTDSQRDVIEQWLESSAIDPGRVLWYEDVISGKALARPDLDRLRDDVTQGRIKTVVCYKLDRLSRNMVDGMTLVAELLRSGCRVVSVTQQVDMTGAMGRMMAAMLFGFAEMELDFRAERQRAGIEVAKRNGTYKGRIPGATKSKNPARASELRSLGLKPSEIATAMGVSERTVFRYLDR